MSAVASVSTPYGRARALVGFSAGMIFGLGLLVSGMNNPAKVRGFLDLFGDWQPALIGVMGPAVVLFAIAFAFSKRTQKPWFGQQFHEPVLQQIDARLLLGAVMFGMGWGLVGLCPGPALVNLASLDARILGFVAMILIGNRLAHYLVGPAKVS